MKRRRGRFGAQALIALLLCGCSSEDPAPTAPLCSGAGFSIPDATGNPVYVSKNAAMGGTGTAETPYASIADAMQAVGDGDVILIGGGTWTESIDTDKAISFVGCGPDATIIVPAAGEAGIQIAASGLVYLWNLTIGGATSYGVSLVGASGHFQGARVEGTLPSTDPAAGTPGGHGIQLEAAAGDAELTLIGDVEITQNAGIGILVVGGKAIVTGTFLEGNGQGGVAIVTGTFAEITGATIRKNGRFGVGLYSTGGKLDQNTIEQTFLPAGEGNGGDGIVVAAADPGAPGPVPEVEITATNRVIDSARLGLLAVTPTTMSVDASFVGNARGGLLAEGAGVQVDVGPNGLFSGNGGFGLCAVQGAVVQSAGGARFEATTARLFANPTGGLPYLVGDGISVSTGATLLLQGAEVSNNARAGLIADSPGAEFIVTGTFFEGGLDAKGETVGKYGVALQNFSGDPQALEEANSFKDIPSSVAEVTGEKVLQDQSENDAPAP